MHRSILALEVVCLTEWRESSAFCNGIACFVFALFKKKTRFRWVFLFSCAAISTNKAVKKPIRVLRCYHPVSYECNNICYFVDKTRVNKLHTRLKAIMRLLFIS